MNEDFDRAEGFRPAPRATRCCGMEIALTALVCQPPQAYARFAAFVMNPEWKFQELLASQRTVEEMRYSPGWTQVELDE